MKMSDVEPCGDVRRFHPPAGRFDGVIGGPPCKGESNLAHLNGTPGETMRDEFRRVVEEVSGKSFADFFSRYVSGTDEIPYNQFLSVAGLRIKLSPASNGAMNAEISEITDPSERQLAIREGLLRGVTQ